MNSNCSTAGAAIIPQLGYTDVFAAAAWLSRAFGLEERLRIGTHRMQMTWLEGAVVRANGASAARASVLVRGPDAVAHHAAVAAGPTILDPPTDFRYGKRQHTADGVAGHHWTFPETAEDVDRADWGGELVATAGEDGT